MRLVFSRKAMAKFARNLRRASWGAAAALFGMEVHLHHALIGAVLGGFAWLVAQILALVVDSIRGD